MYIIRIGNNVHVTWKIYNENGSPVQLLGKIRSLHVSSASLEKEITTYEIQYRNEITFTLLADELLRYGTYKLVLKLQENDSATEDATYDLTQLFQIVARNYPCKEVILEGEVDIVFKSIVNNLIIDTIEGMSAYDIAVAQGFTGSVSEWLNSLAGKSPYIGDNGNWYIYDDRTGRYVDSGVSSHGTVDDSTIASIRDITWVTYGETNWQTVDNAWRAKKLVCCKYDNRIYQLILNGPSVTQDYIFANFSDGYLRTLKCTTTIVDYLPTTTSWSHSETRMALYSDLADNSDIFWVTYGTTTGAQISAAIEAGKAVYLKQNHRIFPLVSYSSGGTYHFAYGYSNSFYTYSLSPQGEWSYSEKYCATQNYVDNVVSYKEDKINKVTSVSSSSTDTQYPSAKLLYDKLAAKQDTLVSGTSIKTINNTSILGSGNITIEGGSSVDIDTNPTSGSSNAVSSGGVYTALAGKQDTLTFDSSPTASSNNPVKSGGVYTALQGKYVKPSGGIPSTDMASAVQTSLGKADSAYQKPSGGIPATDIASGVIPDISGKQDTLVSGTNIKTINGDSILGSGNLVVNTGSDIDTVSVSVDNNTGTPSATGSVSGSTLTLDFKNLKGAQGDVGDTPDISIGVVSTLPSGSTATASISGTAAAPVLNLGIPTGPQGNTGSSVAYPYELVNNLTTNDATKGLSAAQGKAIKDLINTVAYNVQTIIDNLANIAYVGAVPTYEDMGVVSPTWAVTTDLTNYTMAQDISSVVRNRSYNNTLVPDDGYRIGTATVTMGGTDITEQCLNRTTGAISIAVVTGNIAISGVASSAPATSLAFNGIAIIGQTGNYAWFGLADSAKSITPLVPCNPGDSITFGLNGSGTNGDLLLFDENFLYLAYAGGNTNPKTTTLGTSRNYKYCAMAVGSSALTSAFITNNTTGDSFDGSTLPSGNIMTAQDFREYSPLSANIPWENEAGDMMYWNGAASGTANFTNLRSTYSAIEYTSIGTNRASHLANSFISKKVSIVNCGKDGEGKYSLTFYCGANMPEGYGPVLMLDDDTEQYRNYYSAQSQPRTVSISSRYTSVRLMSYADRYADCYIKDEINNEIIWSGSSSNNE